MLKFAATLFTIFSIVLVTTTGATLAQPKAPDSREKTELKEVFEKETAKFKVDSSEFDPVKTDRENAQQQTTKKGWSTTKKALVITAIAVGFAGLLFLVIKYGKNCIRSEPANCNPVTDENCVCLEYERRNP